MSLPQPDSLLPELIRRFVDLERRVRFNATQIPLYDVRNENTPSQITANQDNYDPGEYDVLRLSSDASRNITGISGGKMGRWMTLINTGSNNIVLIHQSTSSLAANRMIMSSGFNVTIGPGYHVDLYYDSTSLRWRINTTQVSVGLIRGAGATLTIAAGSITPTHTFHNIDTEGAAATDDLDTIVTTNAVNGDELTLMSINNARDPTARDGIDNLNLVGSVNFTFLTSRDTFKLVLKSAAWYELRRATN